MSYYPALQIGQSSLHDDVRMGFGSLMVSGRISEAFVTNLRTSDVIGNISEVMADFGEIVSYRFRHTSPVEKNDKLLLTIDGRPSAVFVVRTMEIPQWGMVAFWIVKEQDL